MSELKIFYLVHDQAKSNAKKAIDDPMYAGWKVTISPPAKSRGQECKFHAMIGDIANSKKFVFMGTTEWDQEDIKRLLVDSFSKVKQSMGEPLSQGGRVIPSLDFTGTVQLGIQTRKFTKKEGSDFIEYLFSYGAEIGVEFNG